MIFNKANVLCSGYLCLKRRFQLLVAVKGGGLRDTLVYVVIKWPHYLVVSPTLPQCRGRGRGQDVIHTSL